MKARTTLRTALARWRALPNETRENLIAFLEDDTKDRCKDLENNKAALGFKTSASERRFLERWIAANEAALAVLQAAKRTRVRRGRRS